MTTQLNIGPLRIATLDPGGSGSKTATFYLPAPSDIKLSWEEKGINSVLYNGAESNRRLGFIPQIELTWSIYDDVNNRYGYTIGTSNGNQLTFDGLMSVLDTAPGFLSFSPGLTTGGFVINQVKVNSFGVMIGNFVTGLSITLRGGNIVSTKTLGAF